MMVCATGLLLLGAIGHGCDDTTGVPTTTELDGSWAGAESTHTYSFHFGNWPCSFVEQGHPTLGQRSFTGTYTVADTVNPKRIDFWGRLGDSGFDNSVFLGIYALVGDSLTLAITDTIGFVQRPPNFTTSFDWYTVYRMERQP